VNARGVGGDGGPLLVSPSVSPFRRHGGPRVVHARMHAHGVYARGVGADGGPLLVSPFLCHGGPRVLHARGVYAHTVNARVNARGVGADGGPLLVSPLVSPFRRHAFQSVLGGPKRFFYERRLF